MSDFGGREIKAIENKLCMTLTVIGSSEVGQRFTGEEESQNWETCLLTGHFWILKSPKVSYHPRQELGQ